VTRSRSTFPVRAVIGLIAGVLLGAQGAFVLALFMDWSERTMTQVGILMAGNGATVGAVVGGVMDVLARLRALFPPKDGPEADYMDAAPPRPG
jgi:predicted membrane protein